MTTIFAREVLTPGGWVRDAAVRIGADGRIAEVAPGVAQAGGGSRADILLPAPANLHGHAFQHAMAGLAQRRAGTRESFWSWRETMYAVAAALSPDDIEAIAAAVQVASLEAGFAAVGEFHYLHHTPDGTPHDAPAETALRICAAAAETGAGLCLLPVLYARGGADGRAVEGAQRRFACDLDGYARLLAGAETGIALLPGDARLGVAPHSLRAVPADWVQAAAGLRPGPVHIHAAEQEAEVRAVRTALGARPVEWLVHEAGADARWCLVHATRMLPDETRALAASGAVAGLCPVTEADLGDGIFDGARFLEAGGRFGVGTDSHLRISVAGELRQLEQSQRLRDRARAVMAPAGGSVGRTLLEAAAEGGAQATARGSGRIEPGAMADLVALDAGAPELAGRGGDGAVDAWIFAGGRGTVAAVWSAGRPVVAEGRHPRRTAILSRYRQAVERLMARL